MELNKKAQRPEGEKVINCEGEEMYKDRIDRSFILQGVGLKLKHTFYHSPDEKLDSFVKSTIDIFAKDELFTFAAIKYLKDIGMRLSPAVSLAVILKEMENSSLKFSKLNPTKICLAKHIFTRPDIIANFLAFYKMIGIKKITQIPKSIKKAIKESLENMKEITLKKKMMRGREIKLADLIKAFRPKPRTKEMSELYKGIIENRIRLEDKESLTKVLSDSTKEKSEKVQIMKDNVKSIAINELIRNLSQLTSSLDEETLNDLTKRLNSIDIKNTYQINLFDMIIGQKNFDYRISVLLDDILCKYIKTVPKTDLGKIGILFDVSGSMKKCGIYQAFKMLSFLRTMYDFYVIEFFSNNFIHSDELSKISKLICERNRPNEVYNLVHNLESIDYYFNNSGIWKGTNLHGCLTAFINKYFDLDTVIVFTDEFGNIGNDLKEYNSIIEKFTKLANGKKLIIINVDFCGKTSIDPIQHSTEKVILLSGINAKIFEYIEFFHNFNQFKKRIIDSYLAWINNKTR